MMEGISICALRGNSKRTLKNSFMKFSETNMKNAIFIFSRLLWQKMVAHASATGGSE